jgi:hypothetical protein
MSTSIYRPPQWNGPAMVSVTVPPQNTSTNDTSGSASPSVTQQLTYVFDAVLTLDHEQRLEKTRHPVQTGADISSHAYLMPAQLSLYIGMSDAMAAYASSLTGATTPFTGSPSKSVSAYLTMINLQASRIPLTITTRLRTYKNMIITSVAPHEDSKTITGLRMRIDFEQIFTAAIASQPVSARPGDTDSTGLGQVNTQPPSASVNNQFGVNNANPALPTYNTPGAGSYSSVNTSNLQGGNH